MRRSNSIKNFVHGFVAFMLVCGISEPVFAYVGPGAGLGAVGSLIGLIVALIVGVIGFVWYPLKKLLKNRKKIEGSDAVSDQADSGVIDANTDSKDVDEAKSA